MNDILKQLINQFMPFAQKHIGFNEPPKLFLRQDQENAQNPLGKTAFYDPQQKAVTLYVTGRHPKDILRSLGHELVHHKQNCDGQFDNVGDMGEGYAQNNPHLRKMEFEANSLGSMCLRDFEDGLREQKTIYYEHLQKGEKTMSTKDWKNKEISTLLSEAWGFKFNTLEEFNEFNGAGEVQEEEVEAAAETVDENTEEPVEEAKYGDDKDDKMEEGEDHDKDDKMEEGEDHEDEDPAGKVEESTEETVDEATDTEELEEAADAEEIDERREKRDRPDPRKRPVAEGEEQEALREAIKAVLTKHLKG